MVVRKAGDVFYHPVHNSDEKIKITALESYDFCEGCAFNDEEDRCYSKVLGGVHGSITGKCNGLIFKIIGEAENITEYYFNLAQEEAVKEVVRLAKAVMEKRGDIEKFVMRMGTYYFLSKDSEIATPMEEILTENGYIYTAAAKEFEPINDFIGKWDRPLMLTGCDVEVFRDGRVEIMKEWNK